MISTVFLLTLTFVIQFFTGFGIIRRLVSMQKPAQVFGLSMLTGMVAGSLVVFLLEVMHIRITLFSFFAGQLLAVMAANLKYRDSLDAFRRLFQSPKGMPLYEVVFLACAAALVFISAWRCYYLPITPFDSLTGIDLVAKYAVREGTIASSVFTEHLPTVWYWSNQPYYAPFAALMQIICRLHGVAFGQIWLSVLFISFLVFFYSKLKETLHPVLAGLFLLLFISIPELYAYTFMVQTDFSNAVFFGISIIFFYEYCFVASREKTRLLIVSILFMAFACWSRSETIFFVPFGSLVLFVLNLKKQKPVQNLAWSAAFTFVPLFFFVLWNFVYVKGFLPISPDNTGQFQWTFDNYLSSLGNTIQDMNKRVVFNDPYWSYIVVIFLGSVTLELVFFRKTKGLILFLWLLVLYMMFALMITHMRSVGIGTTFRRGFFKFFPIMIYYFSQSYLYKAISDRIQKWESGSGK